MSGRTDAAIRRLTNLAFAFLGADQRGRRFLTPDWIRTHVPGYGDRADAAFTKQLGRDITTLRRAGVPVEAVQAETGTLYRLQVDDYELPAVTFTPEEAAVLGLAGEMGQAGELAVFARSGWTKLAASGATRDLSEAPVFTSTTDLTRLSSSLLTDVMTTTRHKLRIVFDYLPTPTAQPQRRVMDPWGLVLLNDRVYLVGWDVDRAAPRCFRVLRIRGIRRSKDPATHTEPTAPLQEIVEQALRHGRRLVDAVVRVTQGRAGELVDAGETRGDGTVVLRDVDRDWLVRTAAGFAPDAVVVEPADVRGQVTALLEEAMKR
ncbi:helix-turn-helix transcriptional regulator [Corynebacterium halotolerans]|uniref:Uncharacterized protein n=1 Tax=Corynebacterium halotolerans YIM 70093 = DSM 44683 TaxID=1121362 RepID=M1NM81_9CORY|nr:WYL domain-containing protein [Corynebacterium halotolerans]AGF72468.1 hypothetical protein A605_07330 [Corynebacterium halotolerans YIM 70093 = DSM 44683]